MANFFESENRELCLQEIGDYELQQLLVFKQLEMLKIENCSVTISIQNLLKIYQLPNLRSLSITAVTCGLWNLSFSGVENPKLTYLTLNNNFTAEDVIAFTNSFPNITLFSCGVISECSQEMFIEMSRKWVGLSSLNLQFERNTFLKPREHFEWFLNFPKLVFFKFDGNDYGFMEVLFAALKGPELRTLQIPECFGVSKIEYLPRLSQNCPLIENLDLGRNPMQIIDAVWRMFPKAKKW